MKPGDLGFLRYLYIGSADVSADVAFYRRALSAKLVWRFRKFGADVAALAIGEGPLTLLADHRPPRSTLPIYAVRDLDGLRQELAQSGFSVDHTAETPDGPCLILSDSTGNQVGLLEEVRPQALQGAFADPHNTNAVRDSD